MARQNHSPTRHSAWGRCPESLRWGPLDAAGRELRSAKLNRFFRALTGANADGFVDRAHEDLAVTDATGLGALLDRVDHLMHHLIGDDDLELHLGHEVHDISGTAVNFLFATGAPEALDLSHSHALDTDFRQGILDLVQLERLDNRLDLLHLALHPAFVMVCLGPLPQTRGVQPLRGLPS